MRKNSYTEVHSVYSIEQEGTVIVVLVNNSEKAQLKRQKVLLAFLYIIVTALLYEERSNKNQLFRPTCMH